MIAPEFRIGLGHDRHRLEPGGPLRLGGIDIPFDQQLVGHSDADVLLHAATDAVLGAANLGDIGDLFPDTDPANAKRDSAEFLAEAMTKVRDSGYAVMNLDCTVFAEKPKLGSMKRQMADRIAQIMEMEPGRVSVKAKTGEQVGPVGLGQAIECSCAALIVRSREEKTP